MKAGELKRLRDKCLFYTQFLIQRLASSPELIKGLEETTRLIEKAYSDGKVRPLKLMSAEIDEQVVSHMPLSMAIEFKNLIKEKLTIQYEAVEEAHLKIVDRIVKKGKITNSEEYKLIVSRVDTIFADADKAKELKDLNSLLGDYEK